jgi:phosphatidylserine/phosphatidylglycerophosphate/cardiolipin synthase-like enzyme
MATRPLPHIAAPLPIKSPTPPAPAPPPTASFATCKSDDLAMVQVPGRNVEDPAYRRRKIRSANAWFPSTSATKGNQVVAYTYGRCAFEDMAEAMATAVSSDHRIYIAGWSTNKDVQLKSGANTRLEDFLTHTRAQVRGLFYDGNITLTPLIKIGAGVANKWVADAINHTPNGAAVIDARLPPLAIHHQKILVVQGQFGLVAFLGGIDFDPSRIDVSPDIGSPWHDIHLRIAGPAALDVRKVFEDRWLDHPATAVLDQKLGSSAVATVEQRRALAFPTPGPLSLPELHPCTMEHGSKREGKRYRVAIGRTFGKLQRSGGPRYDFAHDGDYSAWTLIETGIRNALRWIYVEDQYMVSRMARKALLDKLKDESFEFLLVLMTGSGGVANEFKYLVTARNEFRRDLMAIDPSKKRWGMYTLKTPPDPERQKWCGHFVHSKTWIFDDGYSVVGSANCDNRGYTLDSEIVAGIAETNDLDVFIGESFAIDLRTRLWHKHLGRPHAQLRDFEKAIRFWRSPPPSAMIMEYSAYEPDTEYTPPAPFPSSANAKTVEAIWTNLIDPDAR